MFEKGGMMRKEIIQKLRAIGVYLHAGGMYWDPIRGMAAGHSPLFAIWEESEEPTEAEIELLRGIVLETIRKFHFVPTQKFLFPLANTITLKKDAGQWTFRQMTWRTGPPWHTKSGTLVEIKERF
jgi:hypothetical protein